VVPGKRPALSERLLTSGNVHRVFEFQCVQTDPNFANYRYQQVSGRGVLLDFGATRLYDRNTTEAYRRLLIAGLHEDRAAITNAAQDVGRHHPIPRSSFSSVAFSHVISIG
jgi:predicted unusual protein kinase regulating ubiquinone biosynthesis (AarF/ABC1/UbiB family)